MRGQTKQADVYHWCVPYGITREVVSTMQEEGQCNTCGNPIMVGDYWYCRADSINDYCSLSCAKEPGQIQGEL